MRTGTVSYRLEDLKKGVIIPIGFQGENDFTRVIFDAEEVYKYHPDAQVTMKVQPPKGSIYPVTVTRDGNSVIWQVKAADLAHRGSGELQLTFTADTMVEKSYIAKTDIKRSLAGNGPAPDPVQDWVDNAEEVLEDLEAAEVHQPIIGLDGYWYRWDAEAGEYVTTGTKAQGEEGHSPVLTSSKSGKTTTIYSDGDQLAQILDGEDGQGADVIDDTAGEGDTDKTWSADKLADEFGDVLSGIQGKYTLPSGGIPDTDLSSGVQTSLGLADTAYQKPSGGIPASDLAEGVIPVSVKWEKIKEETFTNETSGAKEITVDDYGNPFSLTELVFWMETPVQQSASALETYGWVDVYYDTNSFYTLEFGAWSQAANATAHGAYGILEKNENLLKISFGKQNTSGQHEPLGYRFQTNEIQRAFVLNEDKRFSKIRIRSVLGTCHYIIYGKRTQN